MERTNEDAGPELTVIEGGGEPVRVVPDDELDTDLGRMVFKMLRRDAIAEAAERLRRRREVRR